jgi:hypothetical protein
LLVELPHGATRGEQFDATRRRLVGDYPEELKQFFYVNTDVGSPEVARELVRRAVDPAAPWQGEVPVLLLRSLIPRTFVDCNRVIEGRPSGEVRRGITPGLPAYVHHPDDLRSLIDLHERYQQVARDCYDEVCGSGGFALILHTYAPRTVEIDRIDDGIVQALRRAYEPEAYLRWPRRPAVEMISEDIDGNRLAPEDLVRRLRLHYAGLGLELEENQTYRLAPGTLGLVHARRYPDRVACMEINRALLVSEFKPFEAMQVDEAAVRRITAPLATALLEHLS